MRLQVLASLLLSSGLQATDAVRFAIVSIVTGPVPQPFYAQGITNRALYATRHNYAFKLFARIDHERPASWSKVLALKSTIKSGHFDWILWMDSDALITNFETHLDDFLPNEKEVDLVVSKDCFGVNMGIFLLRCSQSSLHLLEELYNGIHVTNDTINHPWWEQASFIDLYKESEEVRSQIMIVSQKSFNSYAGQSECGGQWTEGDFIVHFPGQGAAERENNIKYYLGKVLEHG